MDDGKRQTAKKFTSKIPYTRRLHHSLDIVDSASPRRNKEQIREQQNEATELKEYVTRGKDNVCEADVGIHPSVYYSSRTQQERISFCEDEDFRIVYPFTLLDLFATIFSIGFFLYDYVSDIVLAETYFVQGRFIPFILTTCFIVVPSLISNIQSLNWYRLDYENEKGKSEKTPTIVWCLRVIFTMPLLMGPAVRNTEYIYHGMKSRRASSKKEQKYHYEMMLYEDNDASLIRLLEAFLESAPQLVLQLYIILTEGEDDKSEILRYVRYIAMMGSWIGLSWSLVAYHRALRAMYLYGPNNTVQNAQNLKISRPNIIKDFFAAFGHFIWRASECGPRVVILALFASQFSYFVLIAAGVHWMIMSFWLFYQKTSFYKSRTDEIIFNIVIGYVLIFSFINTRDGHTRFRAIVYYLIFYAENFSMLLFWVYFTSRKSDWFYFVSISVVSSGCIVQICTQLMYYLMCHPGHINAWVNPYTDYNCYKSVCRDTSEKNTDDM